MNKRYKGIADIKNNAEVGDFIVFFLYGREFKFEIQKNPYDRYFLMNKDVMIDIIQNDITPKTFETIGGLIDHYYYLNVIFDSLMLEKSTEYLKEKPVDFTMVEGWYGVESKDGFNKLFLLNFTPVQCVFKDRNNKIWIMQTREIKDMKPIK